MTLLFRHRADLSAGAQYDQLTKGLDRIWEGLYRAADPSRRAELADQAAGVTRGMAQLAPAVFGPAFGLAELVVYNNTCLIWEHYAAAERALACGEWEPPAGPGCWTAVADHPDALLLWIELGFRENRSRRAELLMQLSDMLSERIDGINETLDCLAATELALLDNASPTYGTGRLAWLRRWRHRARLLRTWITR